MTLLILKLVLAPSLVVASSLAGRRWGPAVAGTLVALPIVAGPILFIAYLEHGGRFAAHAASSSLSGLVSLALFVVVFARQSGIRVTRDGSPAWVGTLLIGWAACLAADLALTVANLSAPVGLCLSVAATLLAARLSMRDRVYGPVPAPRPPRWDLPARAVATAILVLALTTASSRLGPSLTGVLAPFPIGTSVVATFALAQAGAPTARASLDGVLRGLWGFITFCFLVAVLVEPLGGAAAFLIAALGALGTQVASRKILTARAKVSDSAPGGTPKEHPGDLVPE